MQLLLNRQTVRTLLLNNIIVLYLRFTLKRDCKISLSYEETPVPVNAGLAFLRINLFIAEQVVFVINDLNADQICFCNY